jgi:hypothetical protein
MAEVIRTRESQAEAASALARHHRAIADSMIAAELTTKTYRQLADELGVSIGHLRSAKRRCNRRKEVQQHDHD